MKKTLGQIAFEAFIDSVSPKGYCTNCNDWFRVMSHYQEGWEEAAKAVGEAVCQSDIRLCEGVSWQYVQKHKGEG